MYLYKKYLKQAEKKEIKKKRIKEFVQYISIALIIKISLKKFSLGGHLILKVQKINHIKAILGIKLIRPLFK